MAKPAIVPRPRTWRFDPYDSLAERGNVRYAIAALSVALALVATLASRSIFERNPFLFYYAAVMFSAWLGGLWAGLLATLLASVVAQALFLSHFGSLPLGPDDYAEIALFIAVSVVSSSLSGILHKSRARLRWRLQQQETVAALGRLALAQRDIDSFLEEACQATAETLSIAFCKVLELVPPHDCLLLRAGVGWEVGEIGNSTVSAIDDSQAAYTLRVGEPVIVRDVRTETRFQPPPLLVRHGAVSGLSVVIPGTPRPFGVLGVHSCVPQSFSKDDVHFLEGVANLIAGVVQREEKARLLEQSEERFRTLAELIPQMSWSTTADGAVDFISRSWCEFTGLSMEQSLGQRGWQAVLHPEDAARVSKAWEESITQGKDYEVECRLRRADGSYHWILARAVPLRDSDGTIRQWFGTCTDVHTQKMSERALRRAEKLAAAERLASTVAHEINNPLAATVNLVYLARTSSDRSDHPSCGYLEQAEHELRRVSHMVRQALGFYHEGSGTAPADPLQVIDDLLAVYGQKLTARQLRIEKRVSLAPGVTVLSGEFRQVVSALVSNAIDASPIGGAIRLKVVSAHNFTGPSRQCGVRVTVGDRGPGIPESDRAYLFEPFFTTKRDVGAGLSLWVARDIVLRQNAKLRYRTSVQPGKTGTLFTLFFPAASAGPAPAPSLGRAEASSG